MNDINQQADAALDRAFHAMIEHKSVYYDVRDYLSFARGWKQAKGGGDNLNQFGAYCEGWVAYHDIHTNEPRQPSGCDMAGDYQN